MIGRGEIAALGAAGCWTVSSLAFESASKRVGSLAVNVLPAEERGMANGFLHSTLGRTGRKENFLASDAMALARRLAARFKRHRALGAAVQAALKALELEQVPLKEEFAAHTLSAPRVASARPGAPHATAEGLLQHPLPGGRNG